MILLNELSEFVTRCKVLDIEANIDGWIYDFVDDKLSLVGFDNDIYLSYKESKNLVYNGLCDDVVFNFDLLDNCLQNYNVMSFRRKRLEVEIFKINNIKVLHTDGCLNFVKYLQLNDTEVLSDNCLLNSTVSILQADKVITLGRKSLCGCNNIKDLSLKSKVELSGVDIENFRSLIRLFRLELGGGAHIIDEDYYKYRNGRNIVFEHLDLSNVKKISSNILIHLLEVKKKSILNLPALEEIVMYNNAKNLRHSLGGYTILLDNLKSLSADLFYNLHCDTLSLKSLNKLVKNSFVSSGITFLYLDNVMELEEDSFVNCKITNLYLTSLNNLDLKVFKSCKIKTLYLNENCKINSSVNSLEFRSIFHELQRI